MSKLKSFKSKKVLFTIFILYLLTISFFVFFIQNKDFSIMFDEYNRAWSDSTFIWHTLRGFSTFGKVCTLFMVIISILSMMYYRNQKTLLSLYYLLSVMIHVAYCGSGYLALANQFGPFFTYPYKFYFIISFAIYIVGVFLLLFDKSYAFKKSIMNKVY